MSLLKTSSYFTLNVVVFGLELGSKVQFASRWVSFLCRQIFKNPRTRLNNHEGDFTHRTLKALVVLIYFSSTEVWESKALFESWLIVDKHKDRK